MEEKSWRTKAREVLQEKLAQEVDKPAAEQPELLAYKWNPFPTELLPATFARYVREAAETIGCSQSYIALPLLTAAGAAIGNSRRIELKRGWTEPPVLWTVIIGESGVRKSPAFDAAVRFLEEREASSQAKYEQLLAEWQKDADEAKESVGPPPPAPPRTCVGDITAEALARALRKSPRGLLLIRDELSGWLSSFDCYRNGRGGDLASYLTMHRAGTLIRDRKADEGSGVCYVPRALVAVTGGAQPEILSQALTPQFFQSGLTARLLMAMPPRIPSRLTDTELDPELLAEMRRIFASLCELQMAKVESALHPIHLTLSKEAKEHWRKFFEEHAEMVWSKSGHLASAFSKLEGYVPRLALILHLVHATSGDWRAGAARPDASEIGPDSMAAAVSLVRWFANETTRIYRCFGQSATRSEHDRFLEWIRERGGVTTARDFHRAFKKRFENPASAGQVLDRLVQEGFLTMRELKNARGPSTREYLFVSSL